MDIPTDSPNDNPPGMLGGKTSGIVSFVMEELLYPDKSSAHYAKYKDYKLINARVVDTSMAVLDPNEKISSGWVSVIFKKIGLVRVVCYLKHPITQKTAIGVYEVNVTRIN